MTLLLLVLACAHTSPPGVDAGSPAAEAPLPSTVKAHGNLPILTESELATENAARFACNEACADEACRAACAEKYPIRQVEVVPDSPVAPGP